MQILWVAVTELKFRYLNPRLPSLHLVILLLVTIQWWSSTSNGKCHSCFEDLERFKDFKKIISGYNII